MKTGAPNCEYLKIMPELFPNTTKASLASHAKLKGEKTRTARPQLLQLLLPKFSGWCWCPSDQDDGRQGIYMTEVSATSLDH